MPTKSFANRFALLFIASTCLPLIALADGGAVDIEKRAPFANNVAVNSAVRTECALETKIPEYVRGYAQGNANLVDTAGKGARTLSMKIVDVSGAGGGAWSGPKYVTLKGTLRQKGKVIGSFEARRVSGGGAFGGYKGTCKILDRCAKALGKDVAGWMLAPTMNARLGDFR